MDAITHSDQAELFLPVALTNGDARSAFRRIRNLLAGRVLGATRDDALLHELLKCLFCRISLERNPSLLEGQSAALLEAPGSRLLPAYARAFLEVRNDYPEIFSSQEEFSLDEETLRFVLTSLGDTPLLDATRDPIGDAYEVFIGSNVRGQDGQFFTPRNAAALLVAAVAPAPDDLIIDPACGAGGFLTATIQHFAREGRSSSEIRSIAANNLFGIDKDSSLTSLAQAHVALAAGTKPHIVCADSLAWNPQAGERLDSFPGEGKYDVVLTNPPFGSNIVAATGSVLTTYSLARKWRRARGSASFRPTEEYQGNVPPQVLFVEKSVRLARPGGRIGIVVPESLLSSKMHRYVVEYIRSECDILAVAGMPESLFKTSGKGGTHTKTCLLVLRRRASHSRTKDHKVFMAEARWCGHDSRGIPIPHDDLPAIQERFALAQKGRLLDISPLGFIVDEHQIADSVLAPRYYDPNIAVSLQALEETHELITFGRLRELGVLEVATGDEIGKLAYGTGPIPFVRTSDLSSWEIKIDPKHGVSREIFERYRSRQDVKTGDLLMVRDGTYLIGTCAIVSQHDTEIVYQSHIYKIRVLPNDRGIDPFLLLAVLSSDVVQEQIRAKRFTQDIIDSLGDRIDELVLPIWKSALRRREISSLVEKVVATRVESRELSRRVRQMVLRADLENVPAQPNP